MTAILSSTRLKRALSFLGITVAALFVTLLPYFVRGNYLVLYDDGVRQHATFLQYMFEHGIYGGVGGVDYNIGHGGDYLVSFSYYMLFDPVNLLLYVIPHSNFLFAYSALIVIKFILSATFMYVYLRRHNVSFVISTVFSVAYMLGGFMIYTFVRHPDLTAGAMYVPLVTLGLERVIDKKRPFMLILSVFVMTLSSFYMTFMVTVYAVAYAALYYVYGQKSKGNKITVKNFLLVFLRTAACYIIGLLLASFMLFPVAYGYLTASRNASKGLATYGFGDLVSIAASYILPVAGAKYSPIMLSPFIVLLSLAALATPKKTAHKTMSVILTACTFIPFMGYALNMFNYANNRFCFLLTFSAFAMSATHINDKSDRTLSAANYMVKGGAVLIALIVDTAVLACMEMFSDTSTGVKVVLIIVSVAVIALSAFALNRVFQKNFCRISVLKAFNYRYLFFNFALVAVIAAFVHNAPYSAIYDDGSLYDSLNTEAEYKVSRLMSEDDEFYRLDNVTHGKWGDSQNRPLNNDYRGNMIYNTMTASATGDFVTSNNILSFSTNLGMSGVNGRAALQALLACKYYRTGGDEYVPAHYKSTDNIYLFTTDEYIRFGTVFGNTMSLKQYERLPAIERQYAMLGAVAVADGGDVPYSPMAAEVELSEHSFALGSGESKTIELSPQVGKELYLSFRIDDEVAQTVNFYVSRGKTQLSQFIMPKGENMYTGQKDYLFKLDEDGDKITISVSGGKLNFKNVSIMTVDSAAVLRKIRAAASGKHLTATKFASDGFVGTIDSEGGEMFIPLTYSTGWTAYVDGKPTDVKQANVGFMSITVPSGQHKIEFKYKTPLLGAGMTVSMVAAFITLVIAALYIVHDIKQIT